jgi:hypothetical protein
VKESIKSPAAVQNATKALIVAVGISTGDALPPNASLSSLVAMINNELKSESKQQELLQKVNEAIAAAPSLTAAFNNATVVEGKWSATLCRSTFGHWVECYGSDILLQDAGQVHCSLERLACQTV